jgi:hypothetical protein
MAKLYSLLDRRELNTKERSQLGIVNGVRIMISDSKVRLPYVLSLLDEMEIDILKKYQA